MSLKLMQKFLKKSPQSLHPLHELGNSFVRPQTSVQGIQDGWLARDRFFFCGWIDEIMGKDAFFFEEFGKTLGAVE
jgi:hypothetical protein